MHLHISLILTTIPFVQNIVQSLADQMLLGESCQLLGLQLPSMMKVTQENKG